jgi:predicted metal-dependent TIM-barrel fold hydrolase
MAGLNDAITAVSKYRKANDKDFADIFLRELTQAYKSEFVVMTGSGGMDMMEKSNNRDHTEFLYGEKIMTITERDRILQMINSPDRENYEMAKMILEVLTKELKANLEKTNYNTNPNVSNLSNRESPLPKH